MNFFVGLRKKRLLSTALLGAALTGVLGVQPFVANAAPVTEPTAPAVAATAAAPAEKERALLRGATKASYFWDDASGRKGDTGLPASGKPMQKGLFASPSWPLMTEGYIIYKGKKAEFFVGDRGPGVPSNTGVMLDIDAMTFAELTGGTFNPRTLGVDGVNGLGHIDVEYVITKWGPGPGKKNLPVPFSTGAYKWIDSNPATPPDPEPTAPAPTTPAPATPAPAE
jgi:hypothetical protein